MGTQPDTLEVNVADEVNMKDVGPGQLKTEDVSDEQTWRCLFPRIPKEDYGKPTKDGTNTKNVGPGQL